MSSPYRTDDMLTAVIIPLREEKKLGLMVPEAANIRPRARAPIGLGVFRTKDPREPARQVGEGGVRELRETLAGEPPAEELLPLRRFAENNAPLIP